MHYALRARVNHGYGADVPRAVHNEIAFALPGLALAFNWINECRMQYGSNQDMIPIVEALENVTTLDGIMPVQYQSSRCNYEVFRDVGRGFQRLFVGGGLDYEV